MKTLGPLVLVALSFTSGSFGEDASSGEKALDGTWVVESIVRDPKEKGPDEGKGIKIQIKGDRVTFTLPGESQPCPGGAWAIKLDATKTPKTLDIREAGSKGGDAPLAIYELKGDTLKVCWAPLESRVRPSEFASKVGRGHSLVTLTREKP